MAHRHKPVWIKYPDKHIEERCSECNAIHAEGNEYVLTTYPWQRGEKYEPQRWCPGRLADAAYIRAVVATNPSQEATPRPS